MKNSHGSKDDYTAYRQLQQHLDKQPIGFPPAKNGEDIKLLQHIFSPNEALIATCLSHETEPLSTIFQRTGHLVDSREDLEARLDAMVKKGGLEFSKKNGTKHYGNAPLVVGMYELQVNRLTPEFIKDFKAYTSQKRYGISFLSTKLSQMRTIPINKSITPELSVPDFDQIRELVSAANGPFVILPCICRKKKGLLGEPCKQTERTETCMAMGDIAQTLIKMELGRKINRGEAMEIIRDNQRDGLVLQPGNTKKIELLCACCGCCCSMLSLQKSLPLPLDFWAADYKVVFNQDKCIGCGKCVSRCQTDALTIKKQQAKKAQINSSKSKTEKDRPKPRLNLNRCIGCGHCVATCPSHALTLEAKSSRKAPPTTRHELNTLFLKEKQNPLAPVKVIGKLAKGILTTGDIRLLKSEENADEPGQP